MNDLDKAQMMAPEGEFLAYINPKEAGILKALGGSGKLTSMGIPSFTEDEEDQNAMNSPDYSSQDNEEQQSIDRGDPTANMTTMDRDTQGYGPGTSLSDLYGGGGGQGGGNNFFQTIGDLYSRFSPVANIGRGLKGLFDKFADLRGFNPDGSRRTQDEYEKDRQDRINKNRISNIMGREAPFTQMTLDNLSRLGYTGPMGQDLIGTTNNMRTMNDPTFGPVTEGTIYDAEDPELGILSQAPDYNFRDAMREINLQPGFTSRQNLSAANFIDPSKAIGSEDTRDVQSRIGDTFGFNSNYIDLAKNYTKEDLEKAGADKGIFGANKQLDALQNYYNEATKYNKTALGSQRTPQGIREYIEKMGNIPFSGVPGIDMNLVPQDFLGTRDDYNKQKAPLQLFTDT